MKKHFFSPSNSVIIGVAKGLNQTVFQTLDDIVQITLTTPIDTKPVLSFGQKEQVGYSYGQKVFAGTMSVPANAFPSFFELFKDWIQILNYNKLIASFSAEDLPLFDMMIVGIPEYISKQSNYISTFLWTIYGVKIVETSIELSSVSPEGQIMLYRFTAHAAKQQFVNLSSNNGEVVIPSGSLYVPYERTLEDNSFLNIKIKQIYGSSS